MNKFSRLSGSFLLSIGLFVTGGCANLSTLQTARVEKPQKSKLTLGGGATLFTLPSLTTAGAYSTVTLPYIDGMFRIGVAERFDLGFKATLIGNAMVDGKFQFLDTDKFAMAVGLGAGYLPLTSGSVSLHLVDLTLPLYTSFDVNDWFAIYLAPRFSTRFSIPVGASGYTTSVMPMVGGSFGLKLGSSWGFMPEVTYTYIFSSGGFSNIQGAGAFFFGF